MKTIRTIIGVLILLGIFSAIFIGVVTDKGVKETAIAFLCVFGVVGLATFAIWLITN